MLIYLPNNVIMTKQKGKKRDKRQYIIMTEWEIKTAYVMMTEQKETKRGKMQ